MTSSTTTEQVHLRLLPQDTALLRRLAEERDQTLSATVRYLVRKEYRFKSKDDGDHAPASGK
jgi:hypothetical protein